MSIQAKQYEFVHIGNEDKSGWTIGGSGNTVTPITKADFEAATGVSIPNMGSYALQIDIVQAASVPVFSPSLGALDLTNDYPFAINLRTYVDSGNYALLDVQGIEPWLVTTASTDFRRCKDQRTDNGKFNIGVNVFNYNKQLQTSFDAAEQNFIEFDNDVGAYNPASVDNVAFRVHAGGTVSGGNPLTLYVLDLVQDIPYRPIVCITCDDGDETQYDNLFPLLQQEEIPMSAFWIESNLDGTGDHLTEAEAQEMVNSGLVRAFVHGESNYSTLTAAELRADIAAERAGLAARGVAGENTNIALAYPLGDFFGGTTDGEDIQDVVSSVGIKFGRSTIDGHDHPLLSFDPLAVKCFSFGQGSDQIATDADMVDVLNNAAESNAELICITFHKVVTSGATGNQITTAEAEDCLQALRLRIDRGLNRSMFIDDASEEFGLDGFAAASSSTGTGIMQPIMASGY